LRPPRRRSAHPTIRSRPRLPAALDRAQPADQRRLRAGALEARPGESPFDVRERGLVAGSRRVAGEKVVLAQIEREEEFDREDVGHDAGSEARLVAIAEAR